MKKELFKFLVGNGRNLGLRSMFGKMVCGKIFEAPSWRGRRFMDLIV